MQFRPAPDVEKISRDLIGKYHQWLVNVRIEYVYCDGVPKSKGHVVMAKVQKVAGLNTFLSTAKGQVTEDYEEEYNDPYFAMVVSDPIWQKLDDKQRQALIDHELCHMWRDEEGHVRLIGHDLEEFAVVIKRHGLWREDIKQFIEKAGQMSMFEQA